MTRLNLSFLGSPTILLNETEIHIRRNKVLALLAYLAITGQSATRDVIATILWPKDAPKDAYTYLRQTLWHLNKAVGKEWLSIEGERINLQWQAELWVDVQIYQHRLRTLVTQSAPERLATMMAAADLYQGELLAGFTVDDSPEFEQWQLMERSALHHTQHTLLTTIVEQLQQTHNHFQAIIYARQLLALDPLNEAAHRHLMTLYSLTDQQALALRQYQECAQLLARELGVTPDEETTALYAAIREKRLLPFLPTAAPLLSPSLTPTDAHLPSQTISAPTATTPQPAAPVAVSVAASVTVEPMAALPTPITPFIGREHELLQIYTLLNDPGCRLLTLVGPGGIGKTRLALAAAQKIFDSDSFQDKLSILDSTESPVPQTLSWKEQKSKSKNPHFPDGIFFVPLADVMIPDRLAMTIAGVVQFTLYRRDEEPLQQLARYLADKRLLLVLDNFEHLVNGAPQVTTLLAQAPGIKILTTSRERLNVQGEWLLEVSGLLYNQEAPLHQMADYSAVQLFVQCARRVNSGFMLAEENKGAVVRICSLVEGLPLALELAATWLRHLPCREIVTELEQSLTTLTTTQRDLPVRHRSVRALFDYSWSLLSDEERAVMERLSIFRGGFRREAARAVAEAPLPILMALVDKSLLRSDSAGRFSMHELVRQFAAEGLNSQPFAAEGVAQRHFSYYTTWLQQQRGQLHRKAQKRVLGEILAELENIRAAWRRALQQQHLSAITSALDTLADVHELCGWFHEGEAVFQEAVTTFALATDEQQRRLQGRLQARLGFFSQRLAKYSSAQQLLQETYAKLHTLGDLAATSYCLNCLGEIARITGDYEEAERCLTESIALCRRHGDRQLLSRAYNLLGIVYGVRGRHDEAQQLFRDSLALSEAGEDQLGIAKALNNLGIMAYFAGDYGASQRFYQGSLNINQDLGHQYDTALALSNLGLVAQKQGRFDDAVALFEESIQIQHKIGYELGEGLSLRNLCIALLELQQLEAAASHLQEVLRIAQKIRNAPLGLAGLVCLAQLSSLRDDWATAARLATVTHHHPATEDEIRTKAADLLVAAQSHLPVEALSAAVNVAAEAELWQVIAEVMGASL